MAVPPPGDPGGGSASASAGDNSVYIRVPDSEEWVLYSVAGRNQTRVVRVNIWVGWGNEKALVHTGTQSTTADSVVFTHRGLPLLSGQIVTVEFIACTASDVLVYSYFADKRRVR